MTFDELDVTKSKFGLLDLDRDGNAGAGDMKDWLENGYDGPFLPIDVDYPDASGEKNGIKKELEDAADAGARAPVPGLRQQPARPGST